MFLVVALFTPTSCLQAETRSDLIDCSRIENDGDRLRCYDESVRRDASTHDSYLSKQWELDEHKPRDHYVILAHRSNYILPVAYNSSPNAKPFQEASTGEDIQETEAAFQISLKVKLWQDILYKDMDLVDDTMAELEKKEAELGEGAGGELGMEAGGDISADMETDGEGALDGAAAPPVDYSGMDSEAGGFDAYDEPPISVEVDYEQIRDIIKSEMDKLYIRINQDFSDDQNFITQTAIKAVKISAKSILDYFKKNK